MFTDTGTTAALRDIINDFVVASDRIDVSAIGANLAAHFTFALLGDYTTTLFATDFVLYGEPSIAGAMYSIGV